VSVREAKGGVLRILAAAVAGLLALFPATAGRAQAHAFGMAAQVNGVGIANETLERSFQEYLRERNVNLGAVRNPERAKEMRREALDLLIDQELAWQAARREKIQVTESEVDEAVGSIRNQFRSEQAFENRLAEEGYTRERYREHLRQLVAARRYLEQVAERVSAVGDEEVHSFYASNAETFTLPEQVRARHILVKVPSGSGEEGKRAPREKIAEILEKVRSGGDFAELARKYSEDSTSAKGGDLGAFSRGTMVKPFEDAVFALEAGAVSEVVETRYGFHVIKVEERIPEQSVPEEAAREQIRSYLQGKKAREAVQAELKRLRSAAKIEVFLPL